MAELESEREEDLAARETELAVSFDNGHYRAMSEHATPWQKRAEAAEARVAELEKALEPFALVAEHDIGESEADDDLFRPMERHNRAPRLTVGHLRTARRVREGGKVDVL